MAETVRKDAPGKFTQWPTGYPDFPMPQQLRVDQANERVTVSCQVSDLEFTWQRPGRARRRNPGRLAQARRRRRHRDRRRPAPLPVTIAGTATLPSLGVSGTLHTEMGTGAVLDFSLIPGAVAGQPNEILVRLRPGADAGAARARLQRLVPPGNGGMVSGVLRPCSARSNSALTVILVRHAMLLKGARQALARPGRAFHAMILETLH